MRANTWSPATTTRPARAPFHGIRYAFHIVLVYAIYAVVLYFDIPPGPGTGDMLIFAAWAMMFALCVYLSRRKQMPRPTQA